MAKRKAKERGHALHKSRRNKLLHLYEWYSAVLLTCTVGIYHLQLNLHKIISQSHTVLALPGCRGEQQGENSLWETLSDFEGTPRAAASQAGCGHSAEAKFWPGDVVPFSQQSPKVLAVSVLVGKCTRPSLGSMGASQNLSGNVLLKQPLWEVIILPAWAGQSPSTSITWVLCGFSCSLC